MSENDDSFDSMFRDELGNMEMPVSKGLFSKIKAKTSGTGSTIATGTSIKFKLFLGILTSVGLTTGSILYFNSSSNKTEEKQIASSTIVSKKEQANTQLLDTQNVAIENYSTTNLEEITSETKISEKQNTSNEAKEDVNTKTLSEASSVTGNKTIGSDNKKVSSEFSNVLENKKVRDSKKTDKKTNVSVSKFVSEKIAGEEKITIKNEKNSGEAKKRNGSSPNTIVENTKRKNNDNTGEQLVKKNNGLKKENLTEENDSIVAVKNNKSSSTSFKKQKTGKESVIANNQQTDSEPVNKKSQEKSTRTETKDNNEPAKDTFSAKTEPKGNLAVKPIEEKDKNVDGNKNEGNLNANNEPVTEKATQTKEQQKPLSESSLIKSDSSEAKSKTKKEEVVVTDKDKLIDVTDSKKGADKIRTGSSAYFGLEGGVLMSKIIYKSDNPGIEDNLKNSNKQALTYNGMLTYGNTLAKYLNFEVGVGYSKYTSTYTSQNTLSFSNTITIQYTDTFGVHYRDSIVKYDQTVSNSNDFSYQFINIPISLEFMCKLGDKFRLGVSGGVMVNYLYNASAAWIEPTDNTIVTNSRNDFKTISYAYHGSARLQYNISSNWAIYAGGRVNFALNSIYSRSSAVAIKPNNILLNGGLKYYFNR